MPHRLARLSIIFLIALAWQSAVAMPATQVVDLARAGAEAALTDKLWLLTETPGESLTPGKALQSPGWERTSADNLNSAYRPATLWLLGTVHNGGEIPLSRWLVLQPWQLRDVQLFMLDPVTGDISRPRQAGLGFSLADIEIERVHPTFSLDLDPDQTRHLLLRVEDRSFLGLSVRAVDPKPYEVKEAKHRDLYLAFAGFVLAIMAVLLLRGNWRFALAAVWLGCVIVFELSYETPLLLSLWPELRPHMVSLFTISGALTIAVFALASVVFLELYRKPAWGLVYGLLISGILVAAFATPLTEETQLTRWITVRLTLVLMLLWPISVLFSPARKGPYQWGVLILLVGCWLDILVRLMTSTGLLPRIHHDTLVMLYRLAPLGLILGVILLDRLDRRRIEREREQELVASREAARQALFNRQREENLRLSAAVEQQTCSLREATRLAEESSLAKSAFLSTVSHELRAPLHDILGYVQLLARQAPPRAHDHLTIIRDSADQLLHLINDILVFSRGEARPILLEPAPLSLTRLANQLGQVCRPLAERGDNRLIIRVASGETDWVMADEPRLKQILRNLLENACKFTQGGCIDFAITLVEPPGPSGDGRAGAEPLVSFRVTDTGIGIPESQQTAIFQPFKRLDRYQGVPGLGLGLAIAQQLATAMGGRIQVQSRCDAHHGSTFELTLRLPSCEPECDPVEAEPRLIGYRGRRRTLLIADDSPNSLRFLADCCEEWGFRVIQAGDGAVALERVRAAEPPVDVALVDQFMPNLDGWGFLHAVRTHDQERELPVILISAAPLQHPPRYPETLQPDRFALKPLSESYLAHLLGDVLELDWIYEETPSTTETAETAATALPASCSAEEHVRFREMVELGQLHAIRQWAQSQAERQPEHRAGWLEIVHLSAIVDIPGLRRLAQDPD